MIIFGIKFWSWGSGRTTDVWQCAKCGFNGNFILKKGMNFLTFYWIIPTIPVSGIKELVQCPNCRTKYEQRPPSAGGQPPISSPFS